MRKKMIVRTMRVIREATGISTPVAAIAAQTIQDLGWDFLLDLEGHKSSKVSGILGKGERIHLCHCEECQGDWYVLPTLAGPRGELTQGAYLGLLNMAERRAKRARDFQAERRAGKFARRQEAERARMSARIFG